MLEFAFSDRRAPIAQGPSPLLPMAVKEQSLKLDVTLDMSAPADKVFQAFFDPVALGEWLATTRAIAVPRLLGPYVLEWPISTERDEVLGRTGGFFRATVM